MSPFFATAISLVWWEWHMHWLSESLSLLERGAFCRLLSKRCYSRGIINQKFIIKKTDKLKTAKSISIHIIGVLTWINQLKSYSCVCWTVGVFRPQPVLMCWRNYVFIRAVWESMGVQVVSCKVWYLFYTSICHPHQHRVTAKLSTYFTVLNPILWQQD